MEISVGWVEEPMAAQDIGGHRPDEVQIVAGWQVNPVGNPERIDDGFLPGRLLGVGGVGHPPGHRDRQRQLLAPSRARGRSQNQ